MAVDGAVYIVYLAWNEIKCVKSTNGGDSFSATSIPAIEGLQIVCVCKERVHLFSVDYWARFINIHNVNIRGQETCHVHPVMYWVVGYTLGCLSTGIGFRPMMPLVSVFIIVTLPL